MKILRVIHTVAARSGGPIEGLKQASRIMSDVGVEVEIASLDAPNAVAAEVAEMPWRVHTLGPGKLGNFSYSPAMRDWLDANVERYDAVIVHGNWQYHGLATSRACTARGVPYYVYPHGMLDPWFNDTYPLKRLKKKLYWNWGEHTVLKNAQAVLFTCAEECRLARNCFQPYQVNEKVIGYGTNAPEESPQELKATRIHEAPYFLFMARIQEKKGLDLLVDAYATLRTEHENMPDLVIAGPEQQPDYGDRIRGRFDQSGVHWIGSVSGLKKFRLLAGADALVLPSHQENFGIVVAEALAVGTPALISNKVNIHQEISEGAAGIVEEDTVEGTCQLLQKWLVLSDPKKAAMSQAAINTFEKHFEIRRATENLIEYIRETSHSHAD